MSNDENRLYFSGTGDDGGLIRVTEEDGKRLPVALPDGGVDVLLPADATVKVEPGDEPLQVELPAPDPENPDPTYTPGGVATVVGSLTRPANTTAYAQYDLIAALTSGAVPLEMANASRLAGESIRVERARLRSSNPLAKGQTIRVHLFRTAPVLGVSDNGVLNASGLNVLAVDDVQNYVGYLDVTLDIAGTVGACGRGVPSSGSGITTTPGNGGRSLYAVFEIRTVGGYTPLSAETWTLSLEGIRS